MRSCNLETCAARSLTQLRMYIARHEQRSIGPRPQPAVQRVKRCLQCQSCIDLVHSTHFKGACWSLASLVSRRLWSCADPISKLSWIQAEAHIVTVSRSSMFYACSRQDGRVGGEWPGDIRCRCVACIVFNSALNHCQIDGSAQWVSRSPDVCELCTSLAGPCIRQPSRS